MTVASRRWRMFSAAAKIALLSAVSLVLSSATSAAAQAPTAPPPTDDAAAWQILEQRPAAGEQCIVCRVAIDEGDIVEVRYKGRTFHVAAKMVAEFEADPDRYFQTLQARAALFDERAMETPPMNTGWLLFGFYVLAGLICGAGCSYLALDRELPALSWFFAGLAANFLALGAILLRRPAAGAVTGLRAPGLAKIPMTRPPDDCPGCGQTNHPSASSCSSCGQLLHPDIEPETARA